MKKGTLLIVVVVLLGGLLVFSGCESAGMTGAGLGSLAGAGIGALAGDSTEDTLVGAAVGGGAGYIIGSEMDKKKAAQKRQDLQQQINTVTVVITNSNGSKTPVILTKQGVGYLGPRGEYYEQLPTPEQLRPIYGF